MTDYPDDQGKASGAIPVRLSNGSAFYDAGSPPPFVPTGQATITAGTSTSNVALGSTGATCLIQNTGAVTAYVKLGDNTVTAALTDQPVLAGQSFVLATGSATYLAAITASSTAALLISTGTGTPTLTSAGGTGGGGGGTVTQGAPATQNFASSWPIMMPDATASGSITTQNLVPGGTATAGSAVEIALNGQGTVTIQITGTWTAAGGLSGQVTTDGSAWITQGNAATFLRMSTGGISSTIASGAQDIWQVEINGHAKLRITALGVVTGTAVVTIRAAQGTSQVYVNGAVGQSGAWTTAATIADGSDVAQGATTDAANQDPTTNGTLVAFIKGLLGLTGSKTEAAPATDTASSGLNGRGQRIAQRLTSLIALFPSSLGAKAGSASLSVIGASDGFPVVPGSSTTGTLSSVAASASSVTLLAANAGRRSAYIYNDSSLALNMKYGSAASTTSFTYLIPPNAGWQVDDTYTGIITGIWASATGNARVTEVTA